MVVSRYSKLVDMNGGSIPFRNIDWRGSVAGYVTDGAYVYGRKNAPKNAVKHIDKIWTRLYQLRVGGISKQVDKLTGKFTKLFKFLVILALT